MAQLIVNNGNYSVRKDGQIIDTAAFAANAVAVFEDGDFTITKTPDSTVWLDTDVPMRYEIVFTNTSGTTLESIEIRDEMPVAAEGVAGLSLDIATINAVISPDENVTISTEGSSESELIVNVTSVEGDAIADNAVLTITINTNYVAPQETP